MFSKRQHRRQPTAPSRLTSLVLASCSATAPGRLLSSPTLFSPSKTQARGLRAFERAGASPSALQALLPCRRLSARELPVFARDLARFMACLGHLDSAWRPAPSDEAGWSTLVQAVGAGQPTGFGMPHVGVLSHPAVTKGMPGLSRFLKGLGPDWPTVARYLDQGVVGCVHDTVRWWLPCVPEEVSIRVMVVLFASSRCVTAAPARVCRPWSCAPNPWAVLSGLAGTSRTTTSPLALAQSKRQPLLPRGCRPVVPRSPASGRKANSRKPPRRQGGRSTSPWLGAAPLVRGSSESTMRCAGNLCRVDQDQPLRF